MTHHGILARQQRLCDYLSRGTLGPEVVEDLLADGEPFEFETALWDYKLDLPDFTTQIKSDAGLGRLIKVVVSFHNSFGGYIVAGVRDTPRSVVGYSGDFNCDAFNNLLFKYTKTIINCAFRVIQYHSPLGARPLGLLYIPPRQTDVPPVEFRKTFRTSAGDELFHSGQFYLRQSHESVPASTADDFRFLMNPQRPRLIRSTASQKDLVLDNNIPPRDGDLFEFVGRHSELDKLWRWFSDRYSPAKILTGIGGVGKTTIARAFAEQLVEQPPSGLEKIVWLSAKKAFFIATSGKVRPTLKVDFVDRRTMLIGLLNELGGLPEHLGDELDLEELLDEAVAALGLFPALIIVDDVDSLMPDEQYEIFHLLLAITSRASTSRVSSRALLTSRLDLGAGSSNLVRVSGFSLI
jgi:hypothetical protein